MPRAVSLPEKIETGTIRDLNNDHVLSPDGGTIYLSNNDGHLYAVPITGGEPRRVSNDPCHAGITTICTASRRTG